MRKYFFRKTKRGGVSVGDTPSSCRDFLDTMGDLEKGRYIFRSYIRRRTRVRQSVRTEKASKHKDFSMKFLCLSFFCAFSFYMAFLSLLFLCLR